MEIKRIKCPNCGIVLEVKNSKNEAVKQITCPQCKASLRVRFQVQQPLEGNTILPNNKSVQQGGRTYIGDNVLLDERSGATNMANGLFDTERTVLSSRRVQASHMAYLLFDGQQFALNMGSNTVGRKAQTSTATVQIPTSDSYMSRRHIQIVLSSLPNGRQKAVISNDHNKNITTVNGVELLSGEAILLSNGDRIVMGKTTVVYQER